MTKLVHHPYPHNLPLSAKELPAFMRTLYELMGEPVVILNAVGKIVSINPAFTTVFGYSLEDIYNQSAAFIHSNRTAEASYEKFLNELHQDKYWQGDVWYRRKNGSIVILDTRFSAIEDELGRVVHHVGIYSTLEQYESRLTTLAYDGTRDALTGLPNHRLFIDRLENTLTKIQRDCSVLAVIILNIDHFHQINEKKGFQIGDLVLQKMAAIIQNAVRDSDTVARIGADEFAILVLDTTQKSHMDLIINRILDIVKIPHILGEDVPNVTLSIGVASYPISAETADAVFTQAVEAVAQARGQGGNQVVYAGRLATFK